SVVTDRSLQKKHRRQAASHSLWSQQDSGITLSTSMGMIGVLQITLIVPTLLVVMPLLTPASAFEFGAYVGPSSGVIHVMRSAH
ncbi:hypothetical protein, partial [Pseudomonas viridiflava]|uniref:hypothetical protein n=1 Tax=Pseudomonas viridiflava TaxID=33069 RepID=UPI0019D2657E